MAGYCKASHVEFLFLTRTFVYKCFLRVCVFSNKSKVGGTLKLKFLYYNNPPPRASNFTGAMNLGELTGTSYHDYVNSLAHVHHIYGTLVTCMAHLYHMYSTPFSHVCHTFTTLMSHLSHFHVTISHACHNLSHACHTLSQACQ